MANQGKTISQYSLTTTLQTTDDLLLQRGNEYLRVKAQSLTTGAGLSVTYANAGTLKTAETLETGAIYYLNDKYVYITAIGGDKFTSTGVFWTRNADFQSTGVYAGITIANGFTVNATATNLGVWTAALVPLSGDVSIYNNLHWLNISGANGSTDPSVDAVNWEAVANTDILVAATYGYIYEYDSIEYDFDSDVINRRVDLRGNDISVDSISVFQWGNDLVAGNVVDANGVLDIINQLGTITDNYVLSYVDLLASVGTTIIKNSNFTTAYSALATILIYDYTGYTIDLTSLTGAPQKRSIFLIENISQQSITLKDSSIEYDVHLTATAYNAGTTYTFGDFMTVASVTYMYINGVDASGNAAPNTTYWQEVFDKTGGLGAYKFTISRYFNSAGTFKLISTAGTETIDEVVFAGGCPETQYVRFECETGLAVTFDNTAYASLAVAGEILASANVVVDGDKAELTIMEKSTEAIGGISKIMRVIVDQTAYA